MTTRIKSTDPVIRASFAALRRAARRAWKLAVQTGTPFYVMQKGKIVNLNPKRKRVRRFQQSKRTR
jgi:hypothetical protein